MLQCGRRLALQLPRTALAGGGGCIAHLNALPPRSTGAFTSCGGAGDGSSPDPLPAPPVQWHRRRRRPLSPLDRLSRLIPKELLSEEVTDLRGTGMESPAGTRHLPQHLQSAAEHPLNEEPHSISQRLHAGTQPPMEEGNLDPTSDPQPLPAGTQPQRDQKGLDPQSNSQPLPAGTQPQRDQKGLDPLSNSQPLPARTQPLRDQRRMDPHSIPQPLPARTQPFEDEAHLSAAPIAQLSPTPGPLSDTNREEGPLLCSPMVGKGPAFKAGDLCVAEFRRKYYLEFRKMITLTDTGKLLSNWGIISHREITGQLSGQVLKTSTGFPMLFRRPSLEDFVLMMKRGPTISYPKDSHAMLSMMDVTPGDTLLEAGSGSGGMSLFLSRAAGLEGRVLSFEVRSDHHRIAKKNYHRWRDAWEIGHEEKWPDNVEFINKDLCTAEDDLKSITFDAVSLDMVHPQLAIPAVFPVLKSGGVCAVYLANITQVIDLLEGIRVCQLSLLCEKITEVIHKDWLVFPSMQKDGSISQRMTPKNHAKVQEPEPPEDTDSDTEESPLDEVMPFGSVPYIARPFPWQTGHTAFLVKLRKFKPASTNLVPQDNRLLQD